MPVAGPGGDIEAQSPPPARVREVATALPSRGARTTVPPTCSVVFFLLRLLLYQFVAHGQGGLSASVHRSFGSLGRSARHGLDASVLAALLVTAYRRKPEQAGGGGPASASTRRSGEQTRARRGQCGRR